MPAGKSLPLGVLPLYGSNSFQAIAAKHGSIGDMVLGLRHIVDSKVIAFGVNTFTDVAITTSFLGVTMNLLDFLEETFHLNPRKISGRFIASLLTFILLHSICIVLSKRLCHGLGLCRHFCRHFIDHSATADGTQFAKTK